MYCTTMLAAEELNKFLIQNVYKIAIALQVSTILNGL